MSTTARDKAWADQMSLIIDSAYECTEGVTVKGMYEPCGAIAVAVRIDPDEGTPYEVCARHARHEMVPLVTVIDAAKDAGRASVLSALTEERIAETLAKAEDADYWVDEIADWEDGEVWEREAHPDNYPSSAYEDRDYYLSVARAVLALIEQETSK